MAFNIKNWVDRLTEYPTRRTLQKEDGTAEVVEVSRNEGEVLREGDAFNSENMNDLEQRIADEFSELNSNLEDTNQKVTKVAELITLTYNEGLFIPSKLPSSTHKNQLTYTVRNIHNGGIYVIWYDDSRKAFRIGATLYGSLPTNGQTAFVIYPTD